MYKSVQAWSRVGQWKVHSQARGVKFYPEPGPDPELAKRLVWNGIVRADFHFSQALLPKTRGKRPSLPYCGVGSALHLSSYTSSWRNRLQRTSVPITSFTPLLSSFQWQIDGLLRHLLNAPVTGDGNIELADLISTVSLFRPGLCSDFRPSPPLGLPQPTEEWQPVGDPLFCWGPGGGCSFPSALGMTHLCNFYTVFVFLADGLLLIIGVAWWGEEGCNSRGVFCLIKGRKKEDGVFFFNTPRTKLYNLTKRRELRILQLPKQLPSDAWSRVTQRGFSF